MNKREIKRRVKTKVFEWMDKPVIREKNFQISSGAIDFLCTMIENIQDDKSAYWELERSQINEYQRRAIEEIPKALNLLISPRNITFRSYRVDDRRPVITSWEIWHSLSRILDNFCFIPKDI